MLSIARFENVATPPTAATVSVPESVPPAGLAPMATVTLPVNVDAVLPAPSFAVTVTVNGDAAPAVVGGWILNTRLAATPAVMSNAELTVGAMPGALATSL